MFKRSVVKTIEQTIEKIPGLGALIEKLQDSIAGKLDAISVRTAVDNLPSLHLYDARAVPYASA